MVNLDPAVDGNGTDVVPRLFAFVQLFGTPDDYDIKVRLMWIRSNDLGEETADAVARWGPFLFQITGLELVESLTVMLENVPIDEPGVYEFQLRIDGSEEVIAWERVNVQEDVRE